MAQADGVVANGTGSAVRSDINTQYAALWSNHSGSTEPSSGKVAYQFWADTNTNILKIRNSANNAWINLFTLAGGVDVDAASNFNEDVTFTGASANAVWDKSDNALEFADNAKCTFGNSGDLQFYHDGSYSRIIDNGANATAFQTDELRIHDAAANENLAKFVANGAVSLYNDNVLRFNTNSTGAHCTGKLVTSADGGGSDYSSPVAFLAYSSNSNDANTAEIFQGRYNKRALTVSHANTGSVTHVVFEQNDSDVGSITGDGSNVAFNTSSDYRLKENEALISDGIERLKTLKPYRFNFKTTPSKTVDGFFAHEVTAVPEAIHGEKDAVEEDGSIKSQQLDYSKLTPLLTAALQEAITKIETLETKVAALEAK